MQIYPFGRFRFNKFAIDKKFGVGLKTSDDIGYNYTFDQYLNQNIPPMKGNGQMLQAGISQTGQRTIGPNE